MATRTIGLDISARRLLAAEVSGSIGRHPTLHRVHAVELPEGAARDSEVIDVPAVSNALKQLWREGGFRSKRVVLGVGNQRVLVRDHTVPLMPLPQLQQALPYQVADLLPVPVNETILDFYPVAEVEGSDPPQVQGLLVAAIKDSVETNVATLEDAGLRAAGVDLSPFGMLRALMPGGQLKGCHTVVYLGARTTFIVVAVDGTPRFVRIVPAGGETVTDAVEDLTGLEREEAEALKMTIGIDQGADPQYRETADAMLAALRSIFGSIRSTNSYYLSNLGGQPIESLIVMGAETLVPGFVRAVGEYVDLPVTVGTPRVGVRVDKSLDPDTFAKYEQELAIPIGLGLRKG
ncbi:type IV pilus assembly protein PilM [Leucobacter sp. W1478]|uniref:type IV pilus assembly protein PilM n=1 Tax=Leucobacter sp. W1478 TaxID=3439065 RepID=UPI003F38FFB3